MLYPVNPNDNQLWDCAPEKVLETLFKSSDDGLLVVTKRGIISQVNNTLAFSMRSSPDNLIGRPLDEVCRHNGLKRIIKVIRSGTPEIGRIDTIDGRKYTADFLPIINDMRVQGAVAKIIFVNQREQIQDDAHKPKQAPKKDTQVLYTVDSIIGNSPQIIDLKETLLKVAPRNSNVLITGESGTGKELFAHAIHAASLRRSGPFIKINCAAIPDTLLESEFFGYEEGAFTGGKKGGQTGKLEIASGGTVFLDEIGDLPFTLQAKLLRFIQEKEIQKLGASATRVSDVRVVVATNVNLEQMVKYKKFREDLYYRLNVVNLIVPPLRERKEDIIELTKCFIKKFNKLFDYQVSEISSEVETIFQKYTWPGNIRELENVIERAFNIIDGSVINRQHLPMHMDNLIENEMQNDGTEEVNQNDFLSLSITSKNTLEEIMNRTEKIVIIKVLKKCKGNKAKSAQMLGISRPGLYKKLVKYNLI